MMLEPFLKWAGGKRWLIHSQPSLFKQNFNNYFEPFLGSGAIFFHLTPNHAFLSDLNEELINSYKTIRDNHKKVVALLKKHQALHCNDYYYKVRRSNPRSNHGKAARFIYLNRTCWNGLYRVNKNGRFNVPIGTKTKVISESDNFESISGILKNVNILCCDFEETINKANNKDLIFVDPPYAVSHLNNGFLKYNEKLFSWADQERLARSLIRAKNRGAIIIATNANNESVVDLYKREFNISTLIRSSVISGKNTGRNKTEELLILSN